MSHPITDPIAGNPLRGAEGDAVEARPLILARLGFKAGEGLNH